MRWRAGIVAAMAIAVAMLVGGCGTAATSVPSAPSATAEASAPPSEGPSDGVPSGDDASASVVPDSPVAGIIVGIDARGLDQVDGFTLRTNDGETIHFKLGTLENGTEFPPGHLKEHQTTASPVLVFFRVEADQLVVYRVEDAG